MKKILASAALIAAGTAFAGAAVAIDGSTVTVTSSITGSFSAAVYSNNFYGVAFTLDSDTYTNSSGYTLDSISIWSGTSFTAGEYYLVLYSYESNTNLYDYAELTYVGSAAVGDSSSWVLADANDSSHFYTKYTLGTTTTFTDTDGDASVLTSGTSYVVLLVSAGNLSSVQTNLDYLSTSSSSPKTLYGFETFSCGVVQTTTEDVEVDAGLVAANETSLIYWGSASGYTAIVEATLTAIPEPSSFGLLAGVAALAFAASRRRRSRKA